MFFSLQSSIAVLPRLRNISSSNTFSLMITWDVRNAMGSKHRTYSSVSSWSWPKWPFMPPGEANSMRGDPANCIICFQSLIFSCQWREHRWAASTASLGTLQERLMVLGAVLLQCPSICFWVRDTHTPFDFSCPLDSLLVLLIFLFSSSPFSAQRAWRFAYSWANTWL